MKVLFIAVFDKHDKSTNNSQSRAFKRLGVDVIEYNYRVIAGKLGAVGRDQDLFKTVQRTRPELIIISKGNTISNNVLKACNKIAPVCFWWMDALKPSAEMNGKAALSSFVVVDKELCVKEYKKHNRHTYLVPAGFDAPIHVPHNVPQTKEVTFIGGLYGTRRGLVAPLKPPVHVVNNAYAKDHALLVSQSKINLNFCTSQCASERVYKILASKGFLLSDDWVGREKFFKDGEDLVIFKNPQDLQKKINHYLKNDKERERIRNQGFETVQKYTRDNWAKRILDINLKLSEG